MWKGNLYKYKCIKTLIDWLCSVYSHIGNLELTTKHENIYKKMILTVLYNKVQTFQIKGGLDGALTSFLFQSLFIYPHGLEKSLY